MHDNLFSSLFRLFEEVSSEELCKYVLTFIQKSIDLSRIFLESRMFCLWTQRKTDWFWNDRSSRLTGDSLKRKRVPSFTALPPDRGEKRPLLRVVGYPATYLPFHWWGPPKASHLSSWTTSGDIRRHSRLTLDLSYEWKNEQSYVRVKTSIPSLDIFNIVHKINDREWSFFKRPILIAFNNIVASPKNRSATSNRNRGRDWCPTTLLILRFSPVVSCTVPCTYIYA